MVKNPNPFSDFMPFFINKFQISGNIQNYYNYENTTSCNSLQLQFCMTELQNLLFAIIKPICSLFD